MDEFNESSDDLHEVYWNSVSTSGTDDGIQVSGSTTSGGTNDYSPRHEVINEMYLDDAVGVLQCEGRMPMCLRDGYDALNGLPDERRMPECLHDVHENFHRCLGGVSGGQVTGTSTSPLEVEGTIPDTSSGSEDEVEVAIFDKKGGEEYLATNDDDIEDIWDGISDRIDVGGGNSSIVNLCHEACIVLNSSLTGDGCSLPGSPGKEEKEEELEVASDCALVKDEDDQMKPRK